MASRPSHDPLPRPVVPFPPCGGLGRLSPLPPMWLEARFATEYVDLIRDPVYYGRGVHRGGGRPVLLIPGFLAGDQTLFTMQAWLRRVDYKPQLPGITLTDRHS